MGSSSTRTSQRIFARAVADLDAASGRQTAIERVRLKARATSLDTPFHAAEAAAAALAAGADVIRSAAEQAGAGPGELRLDARHAESSLLSFAFLRFQDPVRSLGPRVAGEDRWTRKLASARTLVRHSPPWYYALLKPHCRDLDVWRTVYFHPLDGHDAVVEWFKGSALRPYLDLLDDGERAAFLARYRDEVAAGYPALADGTVLLPFPRLFIVAVR